MYGKYPRDVSAVKKKCFVLAWFSIVSTLLSSDFDAIFDRFWFVLGSAAGTSQNCSTSDAQEDVTDKVPLDFSI